jgi:hypothetical protein
VSETGDGLTKASTDDTLKTDDQGQRRRLTATEKTRIVNVTSGEHGEPGSRWNAKTRRRMKAEEGSDQRVDLKVDPEERTELRNKASKPRGSVVAAGSPVSDGATTVRGHDPTTSRGRLQIGRNP